MLPKTRSIAIFRASLPNEKWLIDITEFRIPAGVVYLSLIIDCFDGMVVSRFDVHLPSAELCELIVGGGDIDP